MGIVRMGIPEEIALFIRSKFDVSDFVETGTFHGDTAVWASTEFSNVYTIEYSEQIFNDTTTKYKDRKDINFVFGDSRQELVTILQKISRPALFWLDAHWCGTSSYGEVDQCPLIEELQLLVASGQDHFIMIDDARLFHAPPPLPNSTRYYPDIFEVLSVMHKGKDRYSCIYEDVIISVPLSAKADFLSYMQDKTTQAWRSYGQERKRMSDLIALGRVGRSILELKKIWLGRI